MSRKYIKVKIYKRSIHKNCMRHGCGKEAKVTAVSKVADLVMDVRYCIEHAEMGGVIDGS